MKRTLQMNTAKTVAAALLAASLAAPALADGENHSPVGISQVDDSDGVTQQEADRMSGIAMSSEDKAGPSDYDGSEDVAESDAVAPDLSDAGEVDATTTGTDPKGD
jgi:hypothetical protein